MARDEAAGYADMVALLAEGVDRNIQAAAIVYKILGSPSSRRAWIEIEGHTEIRQGFISRPPRGGRG